ncbi:MAG: sugar phosphate isomerase/epimerase family protein [Candidatus Bathyarchaeia archaeon]
MRIGLCTIAFRNSKLEEALDLARSVGYEGVEVWGREPHLCEVYDADRAAAVKSQVAARGLQLIGLDEHEAEQELQAALVSLRIAEVLGSPRMRVYGGRKASSQATARDWEFCVKGLRALAETAEDANVTLCVETHGGTLADTTETTDRLVSLVDSPRLRVLFDPVNLWPEDPLGSTRKLRPHIELVHLKNRRDELGRLPLLDEGTVDFAGTLLSLRESGYEGFVDVEFVSETNPRAAAAHDYAYLRRLVTPTR